jgi:ABC-2 type transport system permease protein
VFLAETKRLFSYRAQFWFELILSSLIELVVVLVVWKSVFSSSGQEIINNYSLEQMLLYVTVANFFSQASKGTGIGTFQREIYDGSLTKYLIYPLSFFSYKLGTFLPRSFFAVLQLFLILSIMSFISNIPVFNVLNFFTFCSGLLCLVFACLIFFFMLSIVEMLAFWYDNVWALGYVLQFSIIFLSGKVIPLDLFPEYLQTILSFSPFPLLAYKPASIFIGKLNHVEIIYTLLASCFWLIIFYLLAKKLYKIGLKQYTGVGQ